MIKRLISSVSSLGLIQALSYVVPLISLIYLTKIIGLYNYGIFAFTQSIVAFSLVLLDFGFNLSATEKYQDIEKKKLIISKYISAILSIKLILFLVLALLLLLFTAFTGKYQDHKPILILSLFPILAQGLLPSWFFQGIEKPNTLPCIPYLKRVFTLFFSLFYKRFKSLLFSSTTNWNYTVH